MEGLTPALINRGRGFLNLFNMQGGSLPKPPSPYQIFSCNFSKRIEPNSYPTKLSDCQFQPFNRTVVIFKVIPRINLELLN